MRVAAKPDLRFQTPPVGSIEVDGEALRTQLEADLEGEVRFRPGDRALYATGGSNYRLIPIGVVIPKSIDDVLATLAAVLCADRRISLSESPENLGLLRGL